METIQAMERKPRGGARLGSGRKRVTDEQRAIWFKEHGLEPVTASEILAMAGERKLWYRMLSSPDDSIVLRGLMYLTDRRDGKPAQQINVTSQNITIAASDLERARAIVAEIRGERNPIIGLPQHAESQASLGDLSSTDVRPIVNGT